MTLTPDFPEPDRPEGENEFDAINGGFSDDAAKQFPDEDLSGLDFDLPADFVVPDDLSELDTMPPAVHHEDPDGTQWDDPAWLATPEATTPSHPDAVRGGNPAPYPGAPPESTTPRHPAAPERGSQDHENFSLSNEIPRNILDDFVPALGDKGLDAELAEITGDAVELAVLLTPVADARALAAACALVGLEVTSVPNPSGAVAVLKQTAGDAPAQAAAALSSLLPSFPVLLITKATGQLNAVRYVGGQPPQEVPAGLVVAGASGVVEDLIIGQVTPDGIPGAVSSAGVSRAKAMMWLSKIARRRPR